MKITCKCGQELILVMQDGSSQEGDSFTAFCPKCNKRWSLADTTSDYEKLIINEITNPENGEYRDRDGIWHYKNGKCME